MDFRIEGASVQASSLSGLSWTGVVSLVLSSNVGLGGDTALL